jgi:hypothetical protein
MPMQCSGIQERAAQIMRNLQLTYPSISKAGMLAAGRKELHGEFPEAKNLTRTLSRAYPLDNPNHEPAKRGRPDACTTIERRELAACCRALKAGRTVNGQRRGVPWTPEGVRSVRCCAAVLAKHHIKDPHTLMRKLVAFDPILKVARPRILPNYRPDQKHARLDAASKRAQLSKGVPNERRKILMLDETHAYTSSLLSGSQQRSVVPEGASDQDILTDTRLRAGTPDKRMHSWLAVISPLVGPLAFCFVPQTRDGPKHNTKASKCRRSCFCCSPRVQVQLAGAIPYRQCTVVQH